MEAEPELLTFAKFVSVEGIPGVERYPIENGAGIVSVLRRCRDAFIGHRELDREALDRVAEPAVAIEPERWLTTNDYPESAITRGASADILALYQVGTDGRVATCRLLRKSGQSNLDDALCRALLSRGNFRPARDATGSAISSWQVWRALFFPQ